MSNKLKNYANIKISNVDKKIQSNEKNVKLCNFVDVYYNWHITNDNCDFMIASAKNNEIEKFSLKKGNIAITKDSETRDDIGVSAYIKEDLDNTLLGYHCVLIEPDESKVDGKYLNAFLNSYLGRKIFSFNATGSGQRYTLPLSVIENLKLKLPNIDKQKKIGCFLETIEDIKDNNKKIIKQLEETIETIYNYWFLQYDFPNEEGKPYRSSGGEMVYNEKLKIEIPKGWKATKIKNSGISAKKGELITEKKANTDGNIKVVSAGLDFSYYHDDFNTDKFSVTVSASGANAGYVNFWYEPIFANDCTVIVGDSIGKTVFIYEYLKKIEYYLYIIAKGSAQPHVYPEDIKNIYIPLPEDNLMEKFSKIIFPICESISNMICENMELEELKNYLLPLLMNGQVCFNGFAE